MTAATKKKLKTLKARQAKLRREIATLDRQIAKIKG